MDSKSRTAYQTAATKKKTTAVVVAALGGTFASKLIGVIDAATGDVAFTRRARHALACPTIRATATRPPAPRRKCRALVTSEASLSRYLSLAMTQARRRAIAAKAVRHG